MKRRFRLVLFLLFLALPFTLFSCKSDSDSTTNTIITAPEPPTNLKATQISYSSILLNWTASVSSNVMYIIETYSTNSSTPQSVDTTVALSFTSIDLTAGSYTYKIWAYDTTTKLMSKTAATVACSLVTDKIINLRANSYQGLYGATIGLKWNEINNSINDYYVIVYDASQGGTVLQTISTNGTSITLDMLASEPATKYRFEVIANYEMSTVARIVWAPAKRDTIRIYESNSTMGSGIMFSSTGPTLLGSSDYGSWDLGIDTRSSNFVIGTPSKLSYGGASGGKNTILYIHTQSSSVASLDDIYDTEALTESAMLQGTIPITNAYATGYGYVIALKTADNHFAKVFVKAVGGTFLQGTAPNRYVECEVSYQTLVSAPYAL